MVNSPEPRLQSYLRNDREKVIGREEVLDKSFRWNETKDVEDAALLPSE